MKIREKFENVLKKNPDFDTLCKINNHINGDTVENLEIPLHILPLYKYCPVTSVDVERTFSAYKLILSDKRHRFTPENLEKYIIAYCYKNYSCS